MQPYPARCQVLRLGLVDYDAAWAEQRRLVEACRDDGIPRLLLLEHPPTYTLGARGRPEHLLLDETSLRQLGAAVVRVDRGGDVTFHGPGQLVGYPILDLRRWHQGPLWYVRALEAVLIETLARFGVESERVAKRPGVWVDGAKVASIGVRVSRGITSHGFALNVDPDMQWFSLMVPCGLPDVRMTSVAAVLGAAPPMGDVMNAVIEAFARVFEIDIEDGERTVESPAWAPVAALQAMDDTIPVHERSRTAAREPKPSWLKVRFPAGDRYQRIKSLLREHELHTVCEEARCPNIGECFDSGTATFMILGDVCTRSCGFCAVTSGRPEGGLDWLEPYRVARAVRILGLDYVVITSVNRDDQPDGGAGIFAGCIRTIQRDNPRCRVEVLIPDFMGNWAALESVARARPFVLNHNIETVPRLYAHVRPKARYERSIELLRRAKELDGALLIKSGLMVGLGETCDEVFEVMADLREAGVDLVTIGQYLRPTEKHLPVERYYAPAEFEPFCKRGQDLGFVNVEAGPLVRSSYRAHRQVGLDSAVRAR